MEVQLASDRRRLEERVREHLAWLAELEVRWVRAGGSPAALWCLVVEGRVLEAVSAVERWEAGW